MAASWPKGRLVALRAETEGRFALWPLQTKGRKVHLNFKTAATGYVQAEVVGPDQAVVAGHAFDDCDRLNGDHLDYPITWQGQSDLGVNDVSSFVLRFRLRNAELYSVEFK